MYFPIPETLWSYSVEMETQWRLWQAGHKVVCQQSFNGWTQMWLTVLHDTFVDLRSLATQTVTALGLCACDIQYMMRLKSREKLRNVSCHEKLGNRTMIQHKWWKNQNKTHTMMLENEPRKRGNNVVTQPNDTCQPTLRKTQISTVSSAQLATYQTQEQMFAATI